MTFYNFLQTGTPAFPHVDRVFLWSQSDLSSHQLINQYSHLLHSQLQVQGGVRQTVEENFKQLQRLNKFSYPFLIKKACMPSGPTDLVCPLCPPRPI